MGGRPRRPVLTLYVESSILVRAILDERPDDARALRNAARGAHLITSALTRIELRRALARARESGRLSESDRAKVSKDADSWLRRFTFIRMDDELVERACGDFPVEPVRALDAIHLATVFSLQERADPRIQVATRDERIIQNVRARGIVVR